ncbi:MAG: hypothetical protein IAI50_05420 [Candidatus Eremiobacteraeota bacterium]|nr:hypothetical protein [Candidatus Eremiobacteraeota bacterium]
MRPPLFALAAALLALGAAAEPIAGEAKTASLLVLVAANVSDPSGTAMSQALWAKDVAAYVGASVVPFAGTEPPTLADCHAAHADYLVVAPFDLRPRLPGMPNSSGRVAARTHLVVTNCITGTVIVDQLINFDSDPPSNASEGDFESVPEITWAHAVPATLAKRPVVFERVARITNLNAPFAFVDLKASSHLAIGDGLRDFATPDHIGRPNPIILTVTQVYEKFVQVIFSMVSGGDQPQMGDLVEPLPRTPNPPASATASP